MEHDSPEIVVEAIERYVREEARRLIGSGANWKITLNGSAGGSVRAVAETYTDLSRRIEQVSQPQNL